MKTLSFLLVLNVILFSMGCDDQNDLTPQKPCDVCLFDCFEDTGEHFSNDCKENFECTYEVRENATIVHENDAQVVNGENVVFIVNLYTPGVIEIADDETTDTVVFEIDKNATSFIAEGNDFDILNVKHRIGCFCVDVEFRQVKDGCMQGEKLTNGDWRVQGHLEIVQPYVKTLDFDATFQ
ncbi:MAG: hypothetical protein HKO66_00485 [Saprospiraceae bacterium]|nr:hypothetical protein [Bacteroidia bacterium]NNL90683.1 hypothetical protein [Saprospiraceae bacterium]